MKIEHSAVAILTVPGVIVIITIGVLDKDNIIAIIIQEIKQLAIKINGDAKLTP